MYWSPDPQGCGSGRPTGWIGVASATITWSRVTTSEYKVDLCRVTVASGGTAELVAVGLHSRCHFIAYNTVGRIWSATSGNMENPTVGA